jgi:hypothetical protein
LPGGSLQLSIFGFPSQADQFRAAGIIAILNFQFSIYGDSSPPSIRQRQYKKELETAGKATVNKILDSIEGAKKSLVKLSSNYQAIQSEIVKLRENQCSIYKRAAALEEQGKTDCVKPIADLASKPLRPANWPAWLRSTSLTFTSKSVGASTLKDDQAESYQSPTVSSERAPLFEHCQRAVTRSQTFGVHGLPLMGTGDWNDGMNLVGAGGKGESVWLGVCPSNS